MDVPCGQDTSCFNTNDNAQKLTKERAELFQHIVAKLQYLCRMTLQDIQIAVLFLGTRARSPDEYNYKKLVRVIQYIRDTQYIKLTIELKPNNDPRWWDDSSYAVNPEMKSHTGIFKSIGKGGMYRSSCKQNIYTKSSTEAKLVSIDDAMAQILWTWHFLAAQGVPLPVTVIYQDNNSTSLLLGNGRISSSKRTKHLDVHYFFVTDQIKHGKVKVAFFPTENLLADFFTKPLQGAACVCTYSICPSTTTSLKCTGVCWNRLKMIWWG